MKTPMIRDKTDLVFIGFLLLIAGLLFFNGLGSYFFWDPWEPKYAKAVEEMIARKDYITPYLNDEIRWTKPILIYWAMLFPALLFDVTEWSIRLPSAIAATFGIVTVYYVIRRLRNPGTAFIAAAALATIPQYFYMARQAMPDMLMTSMIIAAMGSFAIARFKGSSNHFYWFYGFSALAFLSKGPVTSVIILFSLFLFFLVDLDWQRFSNIKSSWGEICRLWRYYRITSGILIFIAIAGPWYGLMYLKHEQTFITYFFEYENIARFKKPIRSHHGLITFYMQNIFHGMYPWSSLLPAALLFLFYGQDPHRDSEEIKQRWFFLSWFIAIFLIFSFAGTKQQHYILPITPFVAILVALIWEQLFKPDRAFWVLPGLLLSGFFIALPIRDFLVEGDKYIFDVFTIRIRSDRSDDIDQFLRFFLIAWLAIIAMACFWRKKTIIAALAIMLAVINGLYFTQVLMPIHAEKRSLKGYIDIYKQSSASDKQLIFVSSRNQSSMYYYFDKNGYDKISPRKKSLIAKRVKEHDDSFLIITRKHRSSIIRKLRKNAALDIQKLSSSHAMYYMYRVTKKQ